MDECCVSGEWNETGIKTAREVLLRCPYTEISDLFSALADPTRVKILAALESGELCVCELGQVLQDLSQSAISHQLRLLRSARLVRTRRQGRQIFYALDDRHVGLLMKQAEEHVLEEKGTFREQHS